MWASGRVVHEACEVCEVCEELSEDGESTAAFVASRVVTQSQGRARPLQDSPRPEEPDEVAGAAGCSHRSHAW